jgi:hypothetical protein
MNWTVKTSRARKRALTLVIAIISGVIAVSIPAVTA